MTKPIRRVAVIGAGVMGAGIAAHIANAGAEALLLDIVPKELEGSTDKAARSRVAREGVERLLKSRPAGLFHPSCARLIEVGNVEDHLEKVAGCDLVIEAIIERLDVKRALFEKLERVIGPETIIASNTSGLCIADMLQGRSASFKERFIVLHFFNPVRYMKLLEVVVGPDTSPAVLERCRRFGEDALGKGIVMAKDTPNFVGNRIGAYAMMKTIHLSLQHGLSHEDVDAITGAPMAHPKSASFRTCDMVGLDTFSHVAANCYAMLEKDEERDVFKMPAYIQAMVERKMLGDKTRGGFYKKGPDGAVATLDAGSLTYRPRGGDEEVRKATKSVEKIPDPAARVKKLVADPGKAGAFAWDVIANTLAYSARRVGEIADDVIAIDDGMRWGYNWELGPFETWDALGFVETVERMEKSGLALPDCIRRMKASGATRFYREDGAVFDLLRGEYRKVAADPRHATFTVLRRGEAPVLKNDGAEAWDLGDGVLGLTFKSKANSIDPDVIAMLGKAVEKAESDFKGLVISNDGDHFSVGANLMLVAMAGANKDWESIRKMVRAYQGALQRMKYASVPIVAAPFGMTLGGGLELCFGCDAVQAAAETYAGLVEVGVGLIPGGAGTVNMLWRALEGFPEGVALGTQDAVVQVFKNIALAKVATSALEAKAFGFFRQGDGVSFDRRRQLVEAKAKAIGMADSGYHAPIPRAYKLPGESGIATIGMMVDALVGGGYATEHDGKIARKLATVLCGGPSGATHEVTEQEVLDLEAEVFISLCGEPKSLERMQYMLMNNKPLRN